MRNWLEEYWGAAHPPPNAPTHRTPTATVLTSFSSQREANKTIKILWTTYLIEIFSFM